MRFLVYRTERKVLFIAPPCRAMPGHAMPCDAMRCAACPPLSIWVCGSRACREGRVDRRPPHAARELSRLASPLASHPGLRAVRHACPVLRCEAQLRHGPVRRLCTPCRGAVGLLRIPAWSDIGPEPSSVSPTALLLARASPVDQASRLHALIAVPPCTPACAPSSPCAGTRASSTAPPRTARTRCSPPPTRTPPQRTWHAPRTRP